MGRAKKIIDLESFESKEYIELQDWLVKNVGEIIEDYIFITSRTGNGWVVYSKHKYDRIRYIFYTEWYVSFDARRIKRPQMTWFRLKWKK